MPEFVPTFNWQDYQLDNPIDLPVAAEKWGWDRRKPEVTELKAEVARLSVWVADLQSGMYINCVYCGHRYAPGTGPAMQEVLYEHIKTCPKHPLAKALHEVEVLKARVTELENTVLSDHLACIAEMEKSAAASRVRTKELEEQVAKYKEKCDWHEGMLDAGRLATDVASMMKQVSELAMENGQFRVRERGQAALIDRLNMAITKLEMARMKDGTAGA